MWKCSIQGNGGTLMRRSKRPRSGVDVPTRRELDEASSWAEIIYKGIGNGAT